MNAVDTDDEARIPLENSRFADRAGFFGLFCYVLHVLGLCTYLPVQYPLQPMPILATSPLCQKRQIYVQNLEKIWCCLIAQD
ncbi:unnamed protein product [Phytomonas sp. EM1]|nr:unnamed protein product [Phytomonas sp. EM1]|eukprot:CCW60714.1 unnamed protein product [Phytomonas sp. isolate EM1]